jgi:hypothetical protein
MPSYGDLRRLTQESLNEPVRTLRQSNRQPRRDRPGSQHRIHSGDHRSAGQFYFSSRSREFLGLFAAVAAIGAGLLGGLRALSPRVSGGILSIAAVVLGVIAIVVAVIALIV